jgi:murein DD-endopeptidase MepM/ murein hydrolase activator NlpD
MFPMARRGRSRAKLFLFAVGILALVFVGFGAFRVGPPAVIALEPEVPAIGKGTVFTVRVEAQGRGLAGATVELVQGDLVHRFESRSHVPRPPYAFWGDRTTTDEWQVTVGSESVEGLREGEAQVRVVAERAGSWLRWPEPEILEKTYPVLLVPPSLGVTSSATYVSRGGCEAVVYRVGKTSVSDGVRAGDRFFPGYPLPGGADGERFALFSVPYDSADDTGVRLEASDIVGNRSESAFITRFFPRQFRHDTIRVTDSFMQKVVPAILARTPGFKDRGDLLENYLAVNGEMRGLNAKRLVELSRKSRTEFLWTRPFVSLPNAKVMAGFGDGRSYLYEGRVVDRQVHLGYDLASVRMAEVPAANDGVVLLAEYFGIYGNTVLIDHGYGLQSLYGHLSSLAVEVGREVVRGETIGRTGATGLAGGDHLHFAILLHGVPVNPREWWDGHWIRDRLESKLGEALPFQP